MLEEELLEAPKVDAWDLGNTGGIVVGGIASCSSALTSSAYLYQRKFVYSFYNDIWQATKKLSI